MRERIILAAMNIIERFGFKAITMDDIAHELAMSKKTLYKHFASKTELIEAVVLAWVEGEKQLTVEAMKANHCWQDKMISNMEVYQHRHLPIRLLEEIKRFYPGMKYLIEELHDLKIILQRQILMEARDAGQLREDLDIEVVLLIIGGVIMNVVEEANLQNRELSLSHLIETARKVILYGILREPCISSG